MRISTHFQASKVLINADLDIVTDFRKRYKLMNVINSLQLLLSNYLYSFIVILSSYFQLILDDFIIELKVMRDLFSKDLWVRLDQRSEYDNLKPFSIISILIISLMFDQLYVLKYFLI